MSPSTTGQPTLPNEAASLCTLCAKINFDYLRAPNIGQVRLLAKGHDVSGNYPFKNEPQKGRSDQSWTLGPMERVLQSATSCWICKVISRIFEDVNREEPDRLAPEMVCNVYIALGSNFGLPNSSTINPRVVNAMWPGGTTMDRLSFPLRILRIEWTPGASACDYKHATQYIHAFDPKNPVDSAEGAQAVFCDDNAPDNRLVLCGRQYPPMASTELMKRWMKTCLSQHAECSVAVGGSNSSPYAARCRFINVFRLIDVKAKSIRRFENVDISSLQYAALSYVWGSAQKLMIRHQNKVELGFPGALEGGKASLTIEDAMAVTEGLGLQYLWVDALCILQDDTSDKMVHLDFMGDIYEAAHVTIIAASGMDASAGMAGVNRPRDTKQESTRIRPGSGSAPDLHIVTSAPGRDVTSVSYLDNTTWTTRGWTLQERVLSRRTLAFTATEVFWTCQSRTWAEGMFAETELVLPELYHQRCGTGFFTSGGTLRTNALDDVVDVAWHQYSSLMLEYSTRSLTEPGDGYDAFSAVTRGFSKVTRSACLWALPVTRFELALCWTRSFEFETADRPPRANLRRRRQLTTLPTTTLACRVPFPSWSPLGWIGGVFVKLTDQYPELGFSPELMCYVLRNSPLRIVRVSTILSDSKELSIPPRPKCAPQSPFAVTLDRISRELPHLTLERLSRTPDNQLLFFWAEVATFTLTGPVVRERDIPNKSTNYFHFQVRASAKEGRRVVGHTGLCVPDDPEDEAHAVGQGEFEFALLATNKPHVGGSPPEKVVLQIVWRDGIAYRVSIGDILEEAWDKAMPNMRLMVLG